MNTIDLATKIAITHVQAGEVALFWLGQAGFLLKDSSGAQFVIDPYLTGCGERIRGFKRLTPQLLLPHELEADLCLITHHHFDHYDYDAIPIIACNGKTQFCGPKTCTDLMRRDNVPQSRMQTLAPGDSCQHRGIRVTATRADHGEMAPDAIGALVEMEGLRFYFSGDTAYHREYTTEVAVLRPDVALLSINGEFGNMDAREGAVCAGDLGVKIAIPCHFWTFAEHRGDPLEFRTQLEGSACQPVLMRQGEMLLLQEKQLEQRRVTHESSALYGA